MEELLLKIFSENWLIALMFVCTLYFVIKALKWGINNYLIIIKDHNKNFLISFDKIVDKVWDLADSVTKWNNEHSKEHETIVKFLNEKRNENLEQHKKMLNQIKENNENIKMTHSSVTSLHNLILSWKTKEKNNS